MDLVRARLLTEVIYQGQTSNVKRETSDIALGAFAQIQGEMRERIGYLAGERYDLLRGWLEAYQAEGPLPVDHFLSKLFGEVLSQPGFGFQPEPSNLEAGRVAADLIESARKFRGALELVPQDGDEAAGEGTALGARFVRMVERGVVAATYVQSWRLTETNAVLIAPAYTYLMTNRPVDYQFWINAGASGWWERIYQPLTHPYVLRREWETGRQWTDDDEFNVQQESLYRLVLGLARRCRKGIYLGISELGEQGYEQRGPLLQAVQSALKRMPEQ